jgi:hypothetical protein
MPRFTETAKSRCWVYSSNKFSPRNYSGADVPLRGNRSGSSAHARGSERTVIAISDVKVLVRWASADRERLQF